MKEDVLYIKIEQNTEVVNKKITIQDIAEIDIADNNKKKEIENLVLYTLKGNKDEILVFTIMKVIQVIRKQYPLIQIVNLGETDFIVTYKIKKEVKPWIEWTKVFILWILLFIGAAFTIMTFNMDVSVAKVFDRFYKLVLGDSKAPGKVLEVAYSVGIPIGILSFYNHFSSERERKDPTPVHIEMRKYEEERNTAVIKDASREQTVIKP